MHERLTCGIKNCRCSGLFKVLPLIKLICTVTGNRFENGNFSYHQRLPATLDLLKLKAKNLLGESKHDEFKGLVGINRNLKGFSELRIIGREIGNSVKICD